MEEDAQISGTLAGAKAESYLWQVPGKPVSVRFEFDVIDGILKEVMRGFGLIPRKSVEVGGILLGSAEPVGVDGWLVTVTDYERVPCSYSRGSNWLLNEEETVNFETAARRGSSDQDSQRY